MSISPPSNGFDEGFGFLGWETVAYGTAKTDLDNWWRPLGNTLRRRDEPLTIGDGPTGGYADMLFTGASNLNNRFHFGTKQISGTVTLPGEYDDIGFLLSNAIAHPVTTQFAAGDVGAFSHVFTATNARVAAMPTSFTGQIVRGNLASGSPDRRFTGCMIDRLVLTSRENRVLSCAADIIAQDVTEVDDSITTNLVSAAPWIEFHHAVVRRDAGLSTPDAGDNLTAGKDGIAWTLEIRNNLRAAGSSGRYAGSSGAYNVIRPPVYSGNREFLLTVDTDLYDDGNDDLMFSDALPGNVVRDWSVFLDSGITAAGTKTYQLELLVPRGLVLGDLTEYGGGAGIIPQTVRVKAVGGGASLFVATLQNATDNDTNGDLAGDVYLGTSN